MEELNLSEYIPCDLSIYQNKWRNKSLKTKPLP
jgi:hypothetical protein